MGTGSLTYFQLLVLICLLHNSPINFLLLVCTARICSLVVVLFLTLPWDVICASGGYSTTDHAHCSALTVSTRLISRFIFCLKRIAEVLSNDRVCHLSVKQHNFVHQIMVRSPANPSRLLWLVKFTGSSANGSRTQTVVVLAHFSFLMSPHTKWHEVWRLKSLTALTVTPHLTWFSLLGQWQWHEERAVVQDRLTPMAEIFLSLFLSFGLMDYH